MTKTETIIIGGGIAGLACAQKLQSAGKKFLIITENIGGKIQTTQDGTVNLGACLIMGNHKNILSLIDTSKRIHLTEFVLHNAALQKYSQYSIYKIAQRPLQFIRLITILLRFRSAYERFKKEAGINGQKKALESNQFLLSLYQTPAENFVQAKNIYELTKKILEPPLYACTGLPLSDNSAFDLLRLSLGLISPIYRFSFSAKKITSVFSDQIIIDTVTKIIQGESHTIHTKSGHQYTAKNIVVATPPHIAQYLLDLPEIKKSNDIFAFYVEGELRDSWNSGRYQLFDCSSEMVLWGKVSANTYIIYSKVPHPDLPLFFKNHKIREQKNWCPAFHLIGSILLDCQQTNGLYLIGDHNIAGLEDAYITGLYAANQIINAQ